MTAAVSPLLVAERYDHSGLVADKAEAPGLRGTCLVFGSDFPVVYVADNLQVEFGAITRTNAEDVVQWLRLVANHIEARMDAS